MKYTRLPKFLKEFDELKEEELYREKPNPLVKEKNIQHNMEEIQSTKEGTTFGGKIILL